MILSILSGLFAIGCLAMAYLCYRVYSDFDKLRKEFSRLSAKHQTYINMASKDLKLWGDMQEYLKLNYNGLETRIKAIEAVVKTWIKIGNINGTK